MTPLTPSGNPSSPLPPLTPSDPFDPFDSPKLLNHNPKPYSLNPNRAFGDAPPKRAFGAERLGLPSDLNFAALGLKPSDSRFVDPKVVSWTLSRCRVIYYRALRALRLLALELPPPSLRSWVGNSSAMSIF